MPILSYTESSSMRAGVLNSRVLIGRRLSHGVVLEDPSVSRLHAWIDPVADEHAEWVITDAGSKKGTFVNGLRVTRHPLKDGDIIRIGEVALTYHDQDTLPLGASAVELSSPTGIVRTAGILFECACGAPIWVGSDLAGKRGMCRHCRQPVVVPGVAPEPVPEPAPVPRELPPEPQTAQPELAQPELAIREPAIREPAIPGPALPEPVDAEPAVEPELPPPPKPPMPAASLVTLAEASDATRLSKCAVCHSDIVAGEEKIQCPDCAMNFHAECWQENLGCSSYGCPHVNILAPVTAEPQTKTAQADPTSEMTEPAYFPWDTVLLAASVVGSLLGALLFGSIAAIVVIFALAILVQGKAKRPAFLVLAIVICLIGIAAGLGASDFWYFGSRHLPAVIRQYVKTLH